MKKREKVRRAVFNIVKYNEERRKSHKEFCRHARVLVRHPLPWLALFTIIVYGFGL